MEMRDGQELPQGNSGDSCAPVTMKVVYVAGPFRCASQHVPGQQDSWGIQSNVMSAMALGLEVWRAGAAAVIPHANTMFFQNAAPDNVWLDGDLAMLAKCDAVIMTADWRRSTGARAEHDYARHLGIPVFYWLTDLRSWLELGVTGAEPQPVADAVDPVAQAHPNGLRA